jgi:hypothetical protein
VPDDLAEHLAELSDVIASTNDEEPHPDDPPHYRELAIARRKARELRAARKPPS